MRNSFDKTSRDSSKESNPAGSHQVISETDQIKIVNQIWTCKNVNVVVFRNGDTINTKFLGDDVDGSKYGFLYHIDDVKDVRNIAPEGWRIPSYEDWTELERNIGGSKNISLLRKKGGWKSDVNCNHETKGFNAILAESVVQVDKEFAYLLDESKWWTSDYGEDEIDDENDEPTGDFEDYHYFAILGSSDSFGLSLEKAGNNFYDYKYLPIRFMKDVE